MKIYINALIILLLMLGGLIFIVHSDHADINSKFIDLQNRVYDLSFADEELISDCDSTSNETTAVIHKDVGDLKQALGELVKSTWSIGSLITPTTFCKLLKYDFYNNALQENGDNVCKSKNLNTIEQNNAIKHDTILSLNQDNLMNQTLTQSIKNMFSNNSLIKYSVSFCQNQAKR